MIFLPLFYAAMAITGYSVPQRVTAPPRDTTIKIMWTEPSKENGCTRKINGQYIAHASDAEKAALGLVSTFVASNCDWHGTSKNDMPIMTCELSKALGFELQCSEGQLQFLQSWFRSDTVTLRKLVPDSCASTPPGAHSQQSFSSITLRRTVNTIWVSFVVDGVNLRVMKSWSYRENLYFRLSPQKDQLRVVRATIKKLTEKDIEG